ncbi:Nucleic acid binding protein NABP [Musa troglodytarum]|uniref:Nucleic acid binding protein NABP n=1 Tax=Musa troglodytarum TaxID=320322 RepID=A0A9E7EUB6_9LILI|nr:Nucleic acid binding protein NABP [Musa troglodytarum]URD83560.1 Nucleic acid binding protein NABP [Musa troglodytarum]URD83562.1 Nucleic acid binding protein NABP [Musa troglodytarum]
MLSEMGVRSMIGSGGDAFNVEDLEGWECCFGSREGKRRAIERGSLIFSQRLRPTNCGGLLTAVGGLFGLEFGANVPDLPESSMEMDHYPRRIRSNPAYLSYYYSHVNLNPGSTSSALQRGLERLQVGRSVLEEIGERRKESRWEEQGHISLFSQQPLFNPQEHAVESRKGDSGCKTPISIHPSRPQSRNAYANGLEALGSSDSQLSLNNDISALGRQQPGEYVLSVDGLPHSFASVGSSSHMKSTTPDPQLVARVPSPCLPPFGLNVGANIQKDKDNLSAIVDSDDLIAAISGFSLSTDGAVAAENTSRTELQSELDDHHKFLLIR